MTDENKNLRPGYDLAVIGMAGRFPGANHVDEFWRNLKNGVESITFFSTGELKEAGISPDTLQLPDYVKAAPILEDIEHFDAPFFGYTPKEAEIMDPQTKILHECAWHALEDAGYDPDTYGGVIGIYAGAQNNFYWQVRVFASGSALSSNFATFQLCSKDHISTRISYKLNLTGPSFTLETQCSTSLVAIHLACQALLYGECDMALAGGVTLSIQPKNGYLYQEGMILSSDGHIRAFDARGDGSIFGAGAGIVVLKPIEDAIADGDNILAVIKSSFINNDGNRKVSFAAPSVEGQVETIKAALELAQVEVESISYVECHGTATPLGDQLEIEALNLAFNTDKRHFCRIGTVKSNVGHLDNAAGVAGFIKTVLALKHRLIPPSLHFNTPNPIIDFENSPFIVNTEAVQWRSEKYPRRAGVNSFGVGGTNAHIILEETPHIWSETPSPSRKYQLLLLSAKTGTALDKAAENLGEYLKKKPEISLPDAAYTLQVGRKALQYRKTVVCSSAEGAIQALANHGTTSHQSSTHETAVVQTFLNRKDNRSIYFMFSGLGSHYVNMGLDLYNEEPQFRQEIDRCFSHLQPLIKEDLKEILYPANHNIEEAKQRIKQSEVSQVLVFIFEYALARLLMKWGIKPHAVIGYSFGEYTAACTAGVFSLEDALELIVYRGRLVQQMPEGAMLSVPVTLDQLKPLLEDNHELSIAIDNGLSCIVSGSRAAVEDFEEQLKKKKYLCMPLDTTHAVHSKLMDPILKKLEEKISREITLKEPQIPLISNVTARATTEGEVTTPSYWSTHLRGTVQFAAGIKELVKERGSVFIEIGPGWDLSSLVQRYIEDDSDQHVINPVKHPKKNIPDVYYLLDKLAWLWLYGIKIDWDGFYYHEKRRRIQLPQYPFEGQRYWIDKEQVEAGPGGKSKPLLPGKMPDIADWFSLLEWERFQLMASPQSTAAKHSCWLVFSNELEICSQLVKRMYQDGRDLILVEKGSSFSKPGEQRYTINPRESGDYHMLMKELQKLNRVPGNIFHLWGTGSEPYQNLEKETLENAQDLGLFSLLYLTRALGKLKIKEKLIFNIITNNIHEIIGDEELFPEKATVLALAKTIQQEFTNIKCRCIDIVLPGVGNRRQEYLINQLLDEFSQPPTDTVIAFRGNYRWVEAYKPVRLKEVEGDISLLRKKGVYLITGGLGLVGFILSKYLAAALKAKLILIGRTSLPPRSEWEEYLAAHQETDKISRRIGKVLELEKIGSEVLALSVDITDEKRMKHLISQAEKQFGPINGIIHAAGILGSNTFQLLDTIRKKEFQLQFQPKLYGTLVLHKIFRDYPLDFCLLISSPASILGGLSFAAYASANMFLDAFVYRVNRDASTRWICVNWGDWVKEEKKDRVSSVGVSVDEMLMEPEEGVETFLRILQYCKAAQIVVSAGSLEDRIDKWVKLEFLEDKPEPDKKKPGSFKPRPNLMEPYEPPGNPIEEIIVDIWINLFGYEKIGIHDNFFELGGDSLKLLQVSSKLNAAGYKIDIKDIFGSQTIAQLALLIKSAEETSRVSSQVVVTGNIPLTPFQRAFFETAVIDANHDHQAVILYSASPGGFEEETVKAVFQKIQQHHDALRIMYKTGDGNVLQINQELEHPLSLQVFDFRNCEHAAEKLEDKANEIQSSISLEKGPLMKLGLFHLDDGDRLLIAIHHLLLDEFSWPILLEDVDTLFQQYRKGEEFELPPKSDSFKLWSETLSQYANSKGFLKEKNYWVELESEVLSGSEKNFTKEVHDVTDTGCFSFTLSEEKTANLAAKANVPFGTETTHLLLTALGLAIKKIYGDNRLLIALNGHDREEILTGIEISRTIGCFTFEYPVLLDFSYENNLSRQIKEVKENIKQHPHRRMGYGILKYLTSEENKSGLQFKLSPRIRFKELGQFDGNKARKSFKIEKKWQENHFNLKGQRKYTIDISVSTANKQTVISITYDKKQHKPGTMDALMNRFKKELDHIIAYCLEQENKELTPSDLTYKKLSIDKLEQLEQQFSIEDIYPLSPMQEGMLFHALYDSSSSAYFMQKSYRLQGDLEIAIVEKAVNEITGRYDIFRTVFIHEGVECPLQIVLRKRSPDFRFEDISQKFAHEDKEKFIKALKEEDRRQTFDLSHDVLLRIRVFKVDDREYEFIWSTHHILMDGWCIGQIISEFFEIYESYLEDRVCSLPEIKPYRIYIKWLQEQDKEVSKNHWKKYLGNYKEAVYIPSMKTYNPIEDRYILKQYFSQLDTETTAAVNKLAERNRVTTNTVIQTVWGIILGIYNGKQDVVFGAVVSGRPPGIEGVESIIGLFINTIPIRIRYNEKTKFNDLLKKVQEEAVNSEPHHYYPLAAIQSHSPVKQNLFDNFITFDKYPVPDGIANEGEKNNREMRFKTVKKEDFEQNNYNFNLIVSLRDRIDLEIKYNANVIDANTVNKMVLHLEEVIKIILEHDTVKIEDIKISHGLSKAKSNVLQENPGDFRL